MNIADALIVIALGGLAAALLSLLKVIVHVVFHVLCVEEQAQVSALDRLLADTGYCSSRLVGFNRMPGNGFHFFVLQGPIFALRSSKESSRGDTHTRYVLYVLGRGAMDAVLRHLVGNPRDISVRYVYAPAAWRTSSVSTRSEPPATAYTWQEAATAAVLGRFERHGRATLLVCGAPGTGKSTLGELIAVALHEKLLINAEVVKNFDLTLRGMLLEDAFSTPSATVPVILNLDEFDAMIEHAERTGMRAAAPRLIFRCRWIRQKRRRSAGRHVPCRHTYLFAGHSRPAQPIACLHCHCYHKSIAP